MVLRFQILLSKEARRPFSPHLQSLPEGRAPGMLVSNEIRKADQTKSNMNFLFPYFPCSIILLVCFQDMWLYLSEHEKFNDFGNEASLVWHETNIPYATWGPESTRTLSLKYHPSEVSGIICLQLVVALSLSLRKHEDNDVLIFQALKNNGSLYAHVFFARLGYPVDPNDPEYQPQSGFGRTYCKSPCLSIDSFPFAGD